MQDTMCDRVHFVGIDRVFRRCDTNVGVLFMVHSVYNGDRPTSRTSTF